MIGFIVGATDLLGHMERNVETVAAITVGITGLTAVVYKVVKFFIAIEKTVSTVAEQTNGSMDRKFAGIDVKFRFLEQSIEDLHHEIIMRFNEIRETNT